MNPSYNRLFSLPRNFQTGYGADPASYSFDIEFFPGDKAVGV
jgi:hypothetical protein